MSHRVAMQLPLRGSLVGVRLHQPAAMVGETTPTVQYLLDLKERDEAQRTLQFAIMKCIGRIASAVEPVPGIIHTRLDELGAMVTEMGLAVAREIVGEALDRHLVDPTPVVQRCLRECVFGHDAARLSVALSPGDLAPVLDTLQSDPEVAHRLVAVDFRADASLQPGEVHADTGSGTLMYRPDEVLDRLCDAVRQEVASEPEGAVAR